MRVLVTGSAGKIGRELVPALREAGHEVRTFDRTTRPEDKGSDHVFGDLRDIMTVRQAVRGTDAVLHLGAIAHDQRFREDEVLAINVQGTWNVLLACVESGVGRVVYFSSVNALGAVGGHRPAVQLPIDDAYPRQPLTPYQLSKHLAEETCRSFTERHGIITPCLRPVFVSNPDQFAQHSGRAEGDWFKNEYWAYVDIRDVVNAAVLALTAPNITHQGFLLTADDTISSVPTAELVDRYYPDTPWTIEPEEYLAGMPNRSLFDCGQAKRLLGWQPQYSWRNLASVDET